MAVTVAERTQTAAGVGGHVEGLEDMHRIAGDGSRRSLKVCPSRFGGKAFGFAKIHRSDFSEEVRELAAVSTVCRLARADILVMTENSAPNSRSYAMAKPPVVEPHQLRHALKVAAVTGHSPVRDVALLFLFYGTGLMPNEAAKLLVSDYLEANGAVRVDSAVRAEIAFNGKVRPLIWANTRICQAIDDYLAYRLVARHGVTTTAAAYRGLDSRGPLFMSSDGEPFTFTRRITGSGAISYSCETLAEIVRRLHQQAGIEGGNASAARRTFAVLLHRDGRSLKLIQELIGVSSLSAVKNLIDGDPVRLSAIVRGVI